VVKEHSTSIRSHAITYKDCILWSHALLKWATSLEHENLAKARTSRRFLTRLVIITNKTRRAR
jgi:hypothetical protein